MSKRMAWALVLIGLLVIILLINGGNDHVKLYFKDVKTLKSIIFLGFAALGVVIGLLLK